MEFTIRTVSESEFEDTLQKIVAKNDIQPPNSKIIHRDSSAGTSTYVLTDQFIERLKKASPDVITELQRIR